MKSPQSPFVETSPYLQGRNAQRQGVPRSSCPYPTGDMRAIDWQWGHYDAELEAKAKAKESAR